MMYLAAKAWYEKHQNDRSFEEALGEHLMHGYVWSSPTEFGMAKAVLWHNGIVVPGHPRPNAWFIYLVAGNWRNLVEHLPFHLDWIVWRRRMQNHYRAYKTDELLRKTYGHIN